MPDNASPLWRSTMKRRLLAGAIILVAWSAAIEARLVYLQVIRHNDLAARARDQQTGTVEMPAKRGDILDRNGRVLAFSVDAESVYAVPTDIADADQVGGPLGLGLDLGPDVPAAFPRVGAGEEVDGAEEQGLEVSHGFTQLSGWLRRAGRSPASRSP